MLVLLKHNITFVFWNIFKPLNYVTMLFERCVAARIYYDNITIVKKHDDLNKELSC